MTMRKLSLFAALVVAMGAVSCVEDINDSKAPAQATDGVSFTATFDATPSKAVLEPGAEESKVAWEANDQVSVLVGEGNYLYTAASAGYTTALNTETAGVPEEGTYYGLYPYDDAASLAEGVITTALPAGQTAVLGSFSTHLAVAQAVEGSMAFKNVCGLVKVTIDAENVTKIVFEGNNSEVVAGGINVTVAAEPSWTAVAEQGATSVTLLPASGQTTIAKGAYYFAVLPQTFSKGFKVTAYRGEETWVIRNVTASTVIERAGIVGSKKFFEIEGNGTEDNPYILRTPEHLVGMRSLATLGGETWFRMANDINMEGVTGYLPVNYDSNFERKIHFDGGDFTISNFSYDKSVDGGNYPSLFGVLYGSVKNLKVDKATIISTSVCGVIGGYVGTAGKPGLVENVTITNSTVTNAGDRTGGVCGNAKEATFKNVSFQGTVTSTFTTSEAKAGGFAGNTETSAIFENCSTNVTVTGSQSDLGGFVGKLTGNQLSFTRCYVEADLISKKVGKCRCGGFLGWNGSANAIFTDCHVLDGSTITNEETWSSVDNGNFGGFIGFGDTTDSVIEISGCTASVEINVSDKSTYNGGFIGGTGYASTMTITDCHAEGSVKGANYVGGFFGAVQNALTIERCWSSVDVVSTGQRVGSFVGTTTHAFTIRNCYSTGNATATGQQVAGILGYTDKAVTIKCCYATGDITSNTAGTGGIVGTISGASSTVTDCIAWNKNIICNRSANNKWAPGAVVGAANVAVTLTDCYRRSDMNFYDKADAMVLSDQDNVSGTTPPVPSYLNNVTQSAYHGKAAASNATVTTVARDVLGWSSDIWDFSGDFPTLKAPAAEEE
ncbi:MAG: hypothetical protein E7111_04630 [Bacteroidales bacterium]|nr:hypothetical protein [Bacteroidales bacterium]